LRVVEVDIRENSSEESFGLGEAIFESLDVLRGRVATTVGGLVIRTLYWIVRPRGLSRIKETRALRTITIDCAMGAGLFAVALDLFSTTFIACAADTAPLLHGQ
jgi:hypothetical protein